jgi:hypothetical protein
LKKEKKRKKEKREKTTGGSDEKEQQRKHKKKKKNQPKGDEKKETPPQADVFSHLMNAYIRPQELLQRINLAIGLPEEHWPPYVAVFADCLSSAVVQKAAKLAEKRTTDTLQPDFGSALVRILVTYVLSFSRFGLTIGAHETLNRMVSRSISSISEAEHKAAVNTRDWVKWVNALVTTSWQQLVHSIHQDLQNNPKGHQSKVASRVKELLEALQTHTSISFSEFQQEQQQQQTEKNKKKKKRIRCHFTGKKIPPNERAWILDVASAPAEQGDADAQQRHQYWYIKDSKTCEFIETIAKFRKYTSYLTRDIEHWATEHCPPSSVASQRSAQRERMETGVAAAQGKQEEEVVDGDFMDTEDDPMQEDTATATTTTSYQSSSKLDKIALGGMSGGSGSGGGGGGKETKSASGRPRKSSTSSNSHVEDTTSKASAAAFSDVLVSSAEARASSEIAKLDAFLAEKNEKFIVDCVKNFCRQLSVVLEETDKRTAAAAAAHSLNA